MNQVNTARVQEIKTLQYDLPVKKELESAEIAHQKIAQLKDKAIEIKSFGIERMEAENEEFGLRVALLDEQIVELNSQIKKREDERDGVHSKVDAEVVGNAKAIDTIERATAKQIAAVERMIEGHKAYLAFSARPVGEG